MSQEIVNAHCVPRIYSNITFIKLIMISISNTTVKSSFLVLLSLITGLSNVSTIFGNLSIVQKTIILVMFYGVSTVQSQMRKSMGQML